MKTCSYCGAQYSDDTPQCPIDHTAMPGKPEATASNSSSTPHSQRAAFEFRSLSPEEKQQDLVTLVSCGTLMEADMIVCRLQAAGIEAFIPDKYLMQAVGFNLSALGYVRVQVSPNDFNSAQAALSGS